MPVVTDTLTIQYDVAEAAAGDADWWDYNYSYRQLIRIVAPGGEAVPANYTACCTLDTAPYVTAGKVLANRNDWRIVYWNGSTNTELDRRYIATDETWFKIQAEISAGATENAYYVYYGYADAGSPPEDWPDIYWWADQFEDGDVDGWTSNVYRGTFGASDSSPLEGTYSALMEREIAAGWIEAYDDFTATAASGRVSVEWRILYTGTPATNYPVVKMLESSTQIGRVYQNSSNWIYYGTSASTIAAAAASTEYHFRVDLDLSAKTADVYLDDTLEVTGAATSASADQISRMYAMVNQADCKIDDLFVRLVMTTAPTITTEGETQHVTDTLTVQYDVGITNPVTDTLTVQYDVWDTTVIDALTVQYDVFNSLTDTLTVQYDVIEFVWDGGSYAIKMPDQEHKVTMPASEYAIKMPNLEHTIQMIQTGE